MCCHNEPQRKAMKTALGSILGLIIAVLLHLPHSVDSLASNMSESPRKKQKLDEAADEKSENLSPWLNRVSRHILLRTGMDASMLVVC